MCFGLLSLLNHIVLHFLCQVLVGLFPEGFASLVVESLDIHEDFVFVLLQLLQLFWLNWNVPYEKWAFDWLWLRYWLLYFLCLWQELLSFDEFSFWLLWVSVWSLQKVRSRVGVGELILWWLFWLLFFLLFFYFSIVGSCWKGGVLAVSEIEVFACFKWPFLG